MTEHIHGRDPVADRAAYLSDLDGLLSTSYIGEIKVVSPQQLLEAGNLLPASGPWEKLVELGFGAPRESGDPLFFLTTLPDRWKLVAAQHPMHSTVVDDRGLTRASVFYKATFYDRKAGLTLIPVGRKLAVDAVYGSGPAEPPAQWHALTDEEKRDYVAFLYGYLEDAVFHEDIYGHRQQRVNDLVAQVT